MVVWVWLLVEEDECEMESDCDSFGDSNCDNNSGDDGAYQTDLGIGSGLVTKYIYSKFSSEEDYESFEYRKGYCPSTSVGLNFWLIL
jgi:hypothetical protein